MSLAERDQIILAIIFSIVGLIFLVLIVSFLLWCIIRRYRSRNKSNHSNVRNSSPIRSPYYRPQYQRSQKYLSTKFDIQKRKKRTRRSNTNDSVITLSFDPPHLINKNVKNLEKFLSNESTLTANSWFYEETLPNNNKHCYCTNSSHEPIYTSSSTVLTSISNSAILPQQTFGRDNQLFNELDHVLRVKHPLRYSQSCRQPNEFLPFDYYRSLSPPSTETNSSQNNSLEPIYIRTKKPTNATLMRKARLAQLRDDTAILY